MSKGRLILSILGLLVSTLLFPVLLFLLAGTLNWEMAWIYCVTTVVTGLGSRLIVWKKNPGTLTERAKFTEHDDMVKKDRKLVLGIGLVGPLTLIIISGLDYRFNWTNAFDIKAQWIAAVVFVFGYLFSSWAFLENRFFSSIIRVQKERGQHVIQNGPYSLVRHPGYAGVVFADLVFPVMLNSVWAILPALFSVGILIYRTNLEDDFLQDELEGYADYSGKVRYRLLPGIW